MRGPSQFRGTPDCNESAAFAQLRPGCSLSLRVLQIFDRYHAEIDPDCRGLIAYHERHGLDDRGKKLGGFVRQRDGRNVSQSLGDGNVEHIARDAEALIGGIARRDSAQSILFRMRTVRITD